MKISSIDGGNAFDFGKSSVDYAKYRDIYPELFYDKILSRGLCTIGQTALDVGTGSGVIPRNLCKYGAKWTGADISENQIAQAITLSESTGIEYILSSAEALPFPPSSFDVITACQCYWYFKHDVTAKKFCKILKDGGKLFFMRMDWLPDEDEIAKASEELILKYNPKWTGFGNVMEPIPIPNQYLKYFVLTYREEFKLNIPFTRDSWHGRIKSSRGIGASLPDDAIKSWESEHRNLLDKIAPYKFNILHYAAFAELAKK